MTKAEKIEHQSNYRKNEVKIITEDCGLFWLTGFAEAPTVYKESTYIKSPNLKVPEYGYTQYGQ